jgi:PIN domain nuclease of toxin-antitoxin system
MNEAPAGLLDTHILVWARLDPGQLTRRQRDFLAEVEAREGRLAISAITLWEIAMMASTKKHLKVKASLPSLLAELENNPWIQVLPINAAVAAESVAIRPQLATDPADQMIVATARVFRIPLLTADERIIGSNLAIVV